MADLHKYCRLPRGWRAERGWGGEGEEGEEGEREVQRGFGD